MRRPNCGKARWGLSLTTSIRTCHSHSTRWRLPGFRSAEELRQRFLHVPGVKKVDIVGEQQERIFVEFSYPRLTMLGISPADIFSPLSPQNAVTPAGSVDTDGAQVFVRLD